MIHATLCVILAVTGSAGMLQSSWWAAAAGACAIALLFIAQDHFTLNRFEDIASWTTAQTAASVAIAFIAAPLAFGAGRVSAMIWGL